MGAPRELHDISTRLNALQGRIEAMIAGQLGFERGPGMTSDQETDMQEAACEAIEQWATARDGNPDLVAVTPLQRLLDEYVDAHEIKQDLLVAVGIRS